MNAIGRRRLTVLLAGLLCVSALSLLIVAVGSPSAFAQTNLVANSDLTAGSGDSPQNWGPNAWVNTPQGATFEWLGEKQPAELEIWNYDPSDARWIQPLHLAPGWYHFSASTRTRNVGEGAVGANLSLMDSWYLSRNVRGTNDWQPIGFYLEVPKGGADVVLACRLGFYSSINTGIADFRDISVTPVSAPVNDGDPVFNLKPDHPQAVEKAPSNACS